MISKGSKLSQERVQAAILAGHWQATDIHSPNKNGWCRSIPSPHIWFTTRLAKQQQKIRTENHNNTKKTNNLAKKR